MMNNNYNLGIGCSNSNDCIDSLGCPEGVQPNFCIKRNDTLPTFKMNLEDCDGVVELEGIYELEVNMWVSSKLKKTITDSETTISLADNIGFEQIKENDILIMNRPRNPEKMLILGFNEDEKTISVTRGYDGTNAQSWQKGSDLRIFRLLDAEGYIESIYEDVEKEDGSVVEELSSTFLAFDWNQNATSLPGCYWMQLKLLELDSNNLSNVLSTRRFPSTGEGFLIRIEDSVA